MPAAYSRFTRERIDWADSWDERERLCANLIQFASAQPEPPPLYFQQEADLFLVSRNRDVLGEFTRFAIAGPELVETCLDKIRFAALAEQLAFPVPRSVPLSPGGSTEPPELDIDFPIVLKPRTRRWRTWRPLAGGGKALGVNSRSELQRIWPRLAEAGIDLLAQEEVPGGEDRIESYHVYVDPNGQVAGEFTGRKLRTLPPRFGITTALTITGAGDVLDLGRECMHALGLTGVAKLDFKRAPDGTLYLLEVNPRFSLWHLPGAVAGVNLPALVYADLMDRPRPSVRPVRAGVTWSVPWSDIRAAPAYGLSRVRVAVRTTRRECHHAFALDDPMPLVRGLVWPRLTAARDRARSARARRMGMGR